MGDRDAARVKTCAAFFFARVLRNRRSRRFPDFKEQTSYAMSPCGIYSTDSRCVSRAGHRFDVNGSQNRCAWFPRLRMHIFLTTPAAVGPFLPQIEHPYFVSGPSLQKKLSRIRVRHIVQVASPPSSTPQPFDRFSRERVETRRLPGCVAMLLSNADAAAAEVFEFFPRIASDYLR
jgi:hypothetical protein